METSERPDPAPKRHILQFIGVAIALAAILIAGLYFLNRRTATVEGADNNPIVSQPEEKPADEPKEQPKPEPQTNSGTANSSSNQEKPTQIASAGTADSLWLTLLVIGVVAYLANEYRKSRTAVWRAAMHKIVD